MIFFINLPVGLVALYVLARVRRSPGRSAPFDWVGQTTAIVSMGALTYGLIEAGAAGIREPSVLATLAIAVLALVGFLVAEYRAAQPMVPLHMFRSRAVSVSVAVGFAFTIGFYGLVFLLSLYLQEIRGLSPLMTGLTFVPMTGLTGCVTLLAPRAAARFGPRVPVSLGLLSNASGLLALTIAIALHAPILVIAVLTIPVGFGSALAIPTITAVLLNAVPTERAGTASGLLNTCRQLGGALAVAVFGALIAQHDTFEWGMQISLSIAAVLLVGTAAMSLRLPARAAHR
jgi:DHA2 family methylenomycin A resistance protein-like MFS transporter